MIGKCVKQVVIAVIENHGKVYVGTNHCLNAQNICPRKGMETGSGYELCKSICKQENHAEINAIKNANGDAKGGTLYLIGHTYCCDKCLKEIKKAKIKKVIITK